MDREREIQARKEEQDELREKIDRLPQHDAERERLIDRLFVLHDEISDLRNPFGLHDPWR